MIIEIDFNSDEALYLQLRNQINMHTVNKAYAVLKQEGFVKVDRRRGAVIAIDTDRAETIRELRKELKVILAKVSCKNISREEVHALIDEIYEDYGGID